MQIEHPSGALEVEVELDGPDVCRTAIVRTARKLFDGYVFPRP
jgi:4-oxalomesaconate tautomerase